MKITKYFFLSILLIAASVVSYGFWEKGLWAGIIFTLVWSAFWWIGQSAITDTISSVFFIGLIGACLVGSFIGIRPIFLFTGVVAALNAWDSDRFYRRWKNVEIEPGRRNLEWKHLSRILAVDGVTVLLGVIGLSIKAQMNFRIILLFGILAVLSFSWLISQLRKHSQKP